MAELKTNAEWKQWGKDDPLWGVASWASKQKDGASPWTEQEFYALGESDWQDFSKHWEQYGLNRRCCLEIGCGAGRLTKQLATSFESVCAVDVSEDMIKYARQAVQGAHVEFTVIDGLYLPQSDSSVTAVFSTHVLQHLDAEATGLSYFREFFRVLQVGGSLMVHLPLYQFPDVPGNLQAVLAPQYAIYRVVAGLRADTKRRLGLGVMRSTPYSIKTLIQFLSTVGFKNVEFRIFSLKSNRDYHPFVIRLCHQVVTHRGYYSVWSPGFLLACWSRLMLRFAPAALAVYALLLEWSDG